jgi:transglutaminase superfamily protein
MAEPRPRLDGDGTLALVPPLDVYGVVALDSPPIDVEAPPLEETRAVPEDVDPRLARLADEMGPGTVEERIRRTVDWVGRECVYSHHVGPFRTRDPVPEFLFEKKRGYCEYFASAAALLLRLQGIPTRYVTGFNVQAGDRADDHYVIRASYAHAWIDAWVEGRGWVEVDPTPAVQFALIHPPPVRSTLAGLWEWLAARVAELKARLTTGSWSELLWWLARGAAVPAAVVAVVLGAALGLLRLRRGRRRPGARPRADQPWPAEVQALVAQLDRTWARLGFARPPSRGLLEHLDAIPADRLPPPDRAATREAAERVYRLAFGSANDGTKPHRERHP